MGYLLLFTGFADFFLKDSSWCTKIIHHSLDSVFTRAEPQEQREPLYGTWLPVIRFRLLVMPFKMFHTFANYWLLTVQTERFLVWETENTTYRIIISANFEVFFICAMKIFGSGKYPVPERKFQVPFKPGVITYFCPSSQYILYVHHKLVARELLTRYVTPRDVTICNMADGPCFRDFTCSEGCKSYKVCNFQIFIWWVMHMIQYRLINWNQC